MGRGGLRNSWPIRKGLFFSLVRLPRLLDLWLVFVGKDFELNFATGSTG